MERMLVLIAVVFIAAQSRAQIGMNSTGAAPRAGTYFDINTGSQDFVFTTTGRLGLGMSNPSYRIHATADTDADGFYFGGYTATSGEKDVFTIEDSDAAGSGQDHSSVLKLVKSGTLDPAADGFNLLELVNSGTVSPGGTRDMHWITGRNSDNGSPLWGIDLKSNEIWSSGGILLNATGAAGGTYSGGNFVVEPSGNVGIGTTTPLQPLHVTGIIRGDNAIQIDGQTVIDDGGGWHRSYGNTGWYNGTHGGGLYMSDATWIRTYNNKNFYHNTGLFRTDGTLQVGPSGNFLSASSAGTVINENSANIDFRVESNDNANMLVVAGSSNNVGIGSATPAKVLDIVDNNGGILIPRLTDTNAVSGPVAGELIYGTTAKKFFYYDGTKWDQMLPSSSSGTHYVGELYGGGVVFWVDETREHGLICSMIDLSTAQAWSNITGTLIGATAQSVWNGQGNTTAIIGQGGHTASAAKLCNDYTNANYGTGVYSDWYLPSIDQLNQIWNNRYAVQKTLDSDGNPATTALAKTAYWSSSEDYASVAVTFYFNFGYSPSTSKVTVTYVRAVRAF